MLTPRLAVSERLKKILPSIVVGAMLAAGDFFRAAVPAGNGFCLSMAGHAWLALGFAGYALYAALFGWRQDDDHWPRRR